MKLSTLYHHFAAHPEGGWIMSWPNARLLYNHIKEYQPRKILDLGTGIGCTAAVAALALDNIGVKEYDIHTVDQYQKCYDLAQEIMPQEAIAHTQFYREDVVVWQPENIPYTHFSTFRALPEDSWDLIIVDGPGPFVENGQYVELPNGDVMKMLVDGKLREGQHIVWDKRVTAVRAIERYFSQNFYLFKQAVDPMPFNVLEVRDAEAKFRDERYEAAKESGYAHEPS